MARAAAGAATSSALLRACGAFTSGVGTLFRSGPGRHRRIIVFDNYANFDSGLFSITTSRYGPGRLSGCDSDGLCSGVCTRGSAGPLLRLAPGVHAGRLTRADRLHFCLEAARTEARRARPAAHQSHIRSKTIMVAHDKTNLYDPRLAFIDGGIHCADIRSWRLRDMGDTNA